MKRKLRGIFVLVLAMVALATWGRWWLGQRRRPEHFVKRAEAFAAQGQTEEALGEYKRALWADQGGKQTVGLMLAMADAALASPPAPIDLALQRFDTAVKLWRGVLERQPEQRQVAERLLETSFAYARIVTSKEAWGMAMEDADRLLAIDANHPLALACKAITGVQPLLATESTSDAMLGAQDALRTAIAANPDDPETVYYLARTLLQQAKAARAAAPAADPSAADLCTQARATMEAFTSQHPGSLKARLYTALLLFQQSGIMEDKDAAQQAQDLIQVPEADLAVESDLETRLDVARFQADLAKVLGPAADPSPQAAGLLRAEAQIRAVLALEPDHLDGLLALADILASQGKHAEAFELYGRLRAERTVPVSLVAVRAQRVHNGAVVGLVRLLFRRLDGDLPPADREAALAGVREIVQEAEKRGGGRSAPLDRLEGRLAYHEGRFREAANLIEAGRGRLGDVDPEALLTAGLALARIGETGAAAESLWRYLQERGRTAEGTRRARLELARVAIVLMPGSDRPLELTKGLLEAFPEDPDVILLRGRTLVDGALHRRTAPDAKALLAELDALLAPLLQAGNAEAVRLLAQAQEQVGEVTAARALLGQQLQQTPSDAATLVALLQLERTAKQTDRLRELLRGVAQREPGNPASQLLATELQKADSSPARLEWLGRLALEPDAFERELGLYTLHSSDGQSQAAEDALARAEALAPGDTRLWQIRIAKAAAGHDLERAAQLLAQAEACRVSTLDTELWWAHVELAGTQISAARKRLEELLARCPLYSDARVALGDAYWASAEVQQAEPQYMEALKLKSNHGEALLRLFGVWDQRGQYARATDFLRNALLAAPSEALLDKYVAYLDLHDKQTALDVRRKLAEWNPDPENRREVVRLFSELGRSDEASQELGKLMAEEGSTTANAVAAARVARRSGRGDEGRRMLQEHLRSLGTNAGASDWLAYASYLGEVGHADTVMAYERAVELAPPNAGAVPRELGQYYVARRQYEKALAMFRESMRREPRPETWRQVVGALISLRRYQEAEQELASLKQEHEVDLRVALLDAGTALGQGDYAAALKSAELAVRLAPAAPEARLARAQVLMANPDAAVREEAKADLDKALEMMPASVAARDLLVRWLLQRGSLDEAIVQSERLLELQPESSARRLQLGNLYLSAGRHALLEERLKQWVASAPDAADWLWLRGTLRLAQGKPAAACPDLAGYFAKQKTASGLEAYSRALLASGQAQKALEVLDAELDLVAASPALQGARAAALVGLGRQAEGVTQFAQAAGKTDAAAAAEVQALVAHIRSALTPKDAEPLYRAVKERTANPEVWQQWINALSQLGQTTEAADQLQQYLQTNPPSGRTALLDADLAARRGDRAAALAAVETAVQLSPKDAGAYLFRARLCSADPSPQAQDQVKRDLDQALALAPDLVPAQELQVDWLVRRGRTAEAMEELRRLIRATPGAIGHQRRLARLCLDGGDLGGLEKDLAEWEKASPDAADLHQIRGWLERARSNWALAAAEFAACYAKQPGPQVLWEHADTLLRAAKAAPALELLGRHPETVEQSPALLALRARALATTGAQAEAITVLEGAFGLAAMQGSDPSPVIAAAREALSGDALATLLAQAAKSDPTCQIRWAQARTCLDQGDTPGAIRVLEVLKAELGTGGTQNAAVLTSLAAAYGASGAHDKAQATLREALAGHPEDPTILNALAYELASSPEQAEEALTLALQAVRLSENDATRLPHHLDTLGYAQYQAKQYPEARVSLQRALALQDFAACRIHLAQVALAQDDVPAARQHLEAALRLAEKAGDSKALAQASQLVEELPKPIPPP